MRDENLAEKNRPSDENDETAEAVRRLSGPDRIGRVAEIAATIGGGAAGASAAGTLAATAGASTLLGSTTLASAMGSIFVVSTPVGWIVGSALAGAAAAFGVTRLVRSGGRNDRVREEIVKRLQTRIRRAGSKDHSEELLAQLERRMAEAIEKRDMSETQALRVIGMIMKGTLEPDLALARIDALSNES